MPATIKDIAKRLNLSVSTVSYALNGGPKPVSADVRERVRTVAEELNYRPNRTARSLVTRRNRIIGVALPEIQRDTILSPFVQLALNGIVNAAEMLHQDILLLTAYDRTRPSAFGRDLADSRLDGLVFIAPPNDSPTVTRTALREIPYAIVASHWGGPGPTFESDNLAGSRLAMEHLFSLGHRRIAHVSGRTSAGDATLRRNIYLKFMEEKGLPVMPGFLQPGNYLRESGTEALHRFWELDVRPTAVFCSNDETALGLLDEAKRMGVRVPEDLSVVGYDDSQQSEDCRPSLTTVRQPTEEMAFAALSVVVDQVEGRPIAPIATFPVELMVRDSTGPAQ